MKMVVLFLLSTISATAFAQDITILTDKPIFSEPLAYPRSPETKLSLDTSKYDGHQFVYLDAALGVSVPFATFSFEDFKIQTGAAAATWAMLGYNDGMFPLLTQDFLFSIPVYFRWGNLSAAIKFNHISGHLGDGFSPYMESKLNKTNKNAFDNYKYAFEYKGLELSLRPHINYSRDYLSALVSYDFHCLSDNRIYFHTGYAHRMFPEDLGRYYLGGGLELKQDQIYAAFDGTYNDDVKSFDVASQFGLVLKETDRWTVRCAFTGYIGSDRRGQFVGRKENEYGIGFFIR